MAGMNFEQLWNSFHDEPKPKTVRVRLLIYKGDKQEIERRRNSDGVKGTMCIGDKYSITAIELDPTRLTIRELLRVLFRRESSSTDSE